MSTRRRRNKRQRQWWAFRRKNLIWSMSNSGVWGPDGTIIPGTRYEVWSGRNVHLHG